MKTVQVARRFTRRAWGGTETVVLETSRRLLARGHGAEIFCAGALDATPRDAVGGVAVRRFPYFYPYLGLTGDARSRLDRVGGNLFSFGLLRALLSEPGLDLLHLHTGKRLGGIVRTAARLRGVPYVVTLHGGVHDVPDEEARRWTEPTAGALEWGRALGWAVGARRVLDDASAILCVGEAEQRLTQQRHPRVPVLHLPNGVTPEAFATGDAAAFRSRLGLDAADELLLVVGRVDPQKNQRLAIDVAAELGSSRPRLHLAIVGPVTNEAYRAELGEQVRERGVAHRVHFLDGLAPASPELAGAYHAADLVLVPSVHEPFGIVILEAWASARAVVASRVGGVPGLVDDARDGVLLEAKEVRAWTATVRQLLDAPERRASLAADGKAKAVTRYSWDRITDRLTSVYESARRGRIGRAA
ncbi:MAG: glycosyltransferase family 4 protein [Vicinamibacteria bacterium]